MNNFDELFEQIAERAAEKAVAKIQPVAEKPQPPVYSVADVAEMFGVAPSTVKAWCRANQITHFKLGAVKAFTLADVLNFTERNTIKANGSRSDAFKMETNIGPTGLKLIKKH